MEKERKEKNTAAVDRNSATTYESFYDNSNHGNLEYPVSIYQVDFERTHTHSIRWHWHEEMEILLINSGHAKVTTDDDEQILGPGEGFILNQNVMHSIHSVEGSSCTYYSIVFHPDFLFGYSNSYLKTNFQLPMQSFSVLKTMFLNNENAWHKSMLTILEEILAVNHAKSFGYEMMIKGYLCQFWAALLNKLPHADIPPSSNTALNEQRVKQAMLFIRLHHAETITLEDISDSISVSKSECCRCFKSTIQMTPFEYLMKYRIFEAGRQILDDRGSNHSIADLAISVGFNSSSYFNKLFKRYLDCTPTEYRERVMESTCNTETEPFAIPMF